MVCTELGRSQVEVQRPIELGRFQVEVQWYPLRSEGSRLRSSGAHYAQNLVIEVQSCPLRSKPAVEVQQCPLRAEAGEEIGEEEKDEENNSDKI